ncbi:tetraspanin-14 isoform X1 [Acinonyx jubatus]|uniref:Tetraspanin-14 isoform X1 n=1 Tax=Acinonyx jubatus TaxID=32536 RepID=A0ABM3NWF7_ACIJB|nr:tetraspanin-14 isoform X1 [Acinonyx jubatus]
MDTSHPLCSKHGPQACLWATVAAPGSLLRGSLDILTKFPGDLHTLSSLRSPGSDTSVPPACCSSTFLSLFCGFCRPHPLALLKVVHLKQVWQLRLPSTCHLGCAVSGDPASRKMHYYRYSNAEVSCWYKYLLFSYNIVFWLAGVVFLGVGLWAWSEKGVLSDLTKVTRLHGIDPVVLVLMVGVVMFTLGFAGCVGALRENICLLKFFCGTIVLIFFLELAVAVLAFLFQDWVRDRFREFFESNIRSYRDDIDLQNLIDSLQKARRQLQPREVWGALLLLRAGPCAKSCEHTVRI